MQAKRLYFLGPDTLQQYVDLDKNHPLILTLTISPDGTFVVLGCGAKIHVFQVLDGVLQFRQRLDWPIKTFTANTRNQKINFSVDSKKLTVASQVSATPQKHAVHLTIWECSGSEIRLELILDPIPLTIVGFSV
jgi:hypothetical protein